MVKLNNCTLF